MQSGNFFICKTRFNSKYIYKRACPGWFNIWRKSVDILKLNRLRPGGAVPIKVRAEAAAKSYPEDRKVSEEEKIKSDSANYQVDIIVKDKRSGLPLFEFDLLNRLWRKRLH